MRIAVIGSSGQLATALLERGRAAQHDLQTFGRPHCDLSHPASILRALSASADFDVIINTAAYTAVDKAESEPETAMAINCQGAAAVAEAARVLKLPLLHVSTDYVFDGTLNRPYETDDPTHPIGAYGRSKRDGEEHVLALHSNSVIARTAWVYSPFGSNFVKTMLRLGRMKSEIGVVADQWGNPTNALDLADALIIMAHSLRDDPSPARRGIFHLTGAGDAVWADLAEAVFATARAHDYPAVTVRRIAAKDYPTPAQRPANSRLSNAKLQAIYNLSLPHWRESLPSVVARLMRDPL